ncbi:hypothetical protein HCN51_57050 [Nonomuraea sp. FMUSA5-5]|uniref:Uncharacterized protein n=1 Tax=Nonomuraea composti TaxID=2720023 RepID=A0ABX1BVU9_9ACTN|nr:hypothetical protein [Nonomuraea sp. FMUSA5-5]NJP98833.1 hypothetical protein [Nonomuraea sp. FMUSA5-5]
MVTPAHRSLLRLAANASQAQRLEKFLQRPEALRLWFTYSCDADSGIRFVHGALRKDGENVAGAGRYRLNCDGRTHQRLLIFAPRNDVVRTGDSVEVTLRLGKVVDGKAEWVTEDTKTLTVTEVAV